MKTCRIHVTGASGCGVTTLGRGLGDALAVPCHDADDYFWLPTDPPFREKRPPEDRVRLMRELFAERPTWVLSGALGTWGDPLIPLFDLVVFLHAPQALRLDCLRAREVLRYGEDAVAPGGWQHQAMLEFLEWAAAYDDAGLEQRSLARHETWLATLPCPVLRLDGSQPRQVLIDKTVAEIARLRTVT